MALNIPMPDSSGNALLKGLQTGGNLFTQMMNPRLKREQLSQQMQMHKDSLALQQAAAGRAAALAPLQQMLMQEHIKQAEMQNDPAKKMAYYNAIMQGIGGMGGQQTQQPNNPTGAEQSPSNIPSIGGMAEAYNMDVANPQPMPQLNPDASTGYQSPEQLMQQQAMQQGFGGFTPQQQIAMGLAGIKIPKPVESPDMKRFEELQNKIKFEHEKTALKKKALEDKESVAIKKDLPALQSSLQGVDELLKIAKGNPDLFGHTFMPERFAKTTNNKQFGKWQNLIADRIAGLEGKLSSKGNIVALKLAQSLKPSHAESQQVAIGKLESMREELEKSINKSKSLLGERPDSDIMDFSKMSDDELRRIAGGG